MMNINCLRKEEGLVSYRMGGLKVRFKLFSRPPIFSIGNEFMIAYYIIRKKFKNESFIK